MLNSVESSTQSCWTPFVTGNGSENSPSFCTLCKHTIAELPRHRYEVGKTAIFAIIFQKSLTTDWVRCFGKVDKGHVEVHILFLAFLLKLSCYEDHAFCSSVFSESHSHSGRSPDCSRCSFNRFSRTLARIFSALDMKELPWWLSNTLGFPFLLNRWIIVLHPWVLEGWLLFSTSCAITLSVSLQLEDLLFCRFLQVLHMIMEPCNSSVSFSAIGGPTVL